jgi:hypothetical protein
VDVARRRAGAAALLVRPCPPVRRRTAPRRRPRSAERHSGARARAGDGHLRGHRPDRREDGVDPDLVGLHADARASRVDRHRARGAGRRGSGRRHRRPERRGGPHGALRLLRRSRHERRPGVRRSPVPVAEPCCAGACRATGCATDVGGSRAACGRSGRGARPGAALRSLRGGRVQGGP